MKFTKFAIVFAFLLSLCAFALTAFLSTVRENEKEKRITLQTAKLELEAKVRTYEEEKSNYQKQIESLNTELQEAKATVESDKAALEQLRKELEDRDKLLEQRKKEIDELQKAVQLSEDRNRELETTLEQFEKTLQQMKMKPFDTTDTFSEQPAALPMMQSQPPVLLLEEPAKPVSEPEKPAQSQSPKASASVSAEPEKAETAAPAAVPVQPETASQSLQAGRVLLVNQKFNFVVVNIGLKQGLSIGDAFVVSEGDTKLAKVEVEKLYDDFAAAKITEMLGQKSLLKEGNLVTRL